MARKPGSASLAASLEVLAGAPLDARTVVGTKTDLTTAATYSYVYVGMIVSVEDEGNAYILTAADYTDSDNWKLIGSGAGGGVVEGYFNPTDNLFYEESTYETAITGASGMLYVSLDTNKLYRYNGSIFVIVSDIDITVYQPAGSVLFANLPAASVSTLGFVYDIQDDFVTTADFVEGAGKEYQAGTNVVIVNAGTAQVPVYKYDILSGRKETKEITLAEFNALTTAEKNNGTAYFIPDADVVSNLTVVGNKFDKANIYTATERVVGSYLGKPLYQKTISGITLVTNDTVTTAHGITGIERVVDVFGVARATSGNHSQYYIPELMDTKDGNAITVNDTNIVVTTYSGFGGMVVDLTIRYTKTGDGTVSIGTENDYSTTEQMIGTWIDGKPLYQKVYHYTNLLSDATVHDMDTVPSEFNVVKLDAYQNGNGWCMALPYKQVGDTYIAWVDVSGAKIRWYSKWDGMTVSNLFVIVQYTKTTD